MNSAPRTQALDCPGCGRPMRSLVLERRPIGTETVDLCPSCRALWFDTFESTQLASTATVALFREIHAASVDPRAALPQSMRCPRCNETLLLTHDVARTTRFAYHRCPYGHGRFTPFVQFLREKSFMRPLAAAELARLKQAVRTVRCSGCGAPINLATMTSCAYCHAPIEIIDPDAVAKALADFAAQQPARPPVNVDVLALDFAIAQRTYERQPPSTGAVFDLVGAGVDAIVGLLDR